MAGDHATPREASIRYRSASASRTLARTNQADALTGAAVSKRWGAAARP
jgi:hypothetical protein